TSPWASPHSSGNPSHRLSAVQRTVSGRERSRTGERPLPCARFDDCMNTARIDTERLGEDPDDGRLDVPHIAGEGSRIGTRYAIECTYAPQLSRPSAQTPRQAR